MHLQIMYKLLLLFFSGGALCGTAPQSGWAIFFNFPNHTSFSARHTICTTWDLENQTMKCGPLVLIFARARTLCRHAARWYNMCDARRHNASDTSLFAQLVTINRHVSANILFSKNREPSFRSRSSCGPTYIWPHVAPLVAPAERERCIVWPAQMLKMLFHVLLSAAC